MLHLKMSFLKNNVPIWGLLFVLFQLSECTSATVISRKDPEFNEPLRHILIVYKAESAKDSLGFFFGQKLQTLMKKQGIEAELSVLESLSMQSEENWRQQNRENTKQILLVLQRGTATVISPPDRANELDVTTGYTAMYRISLYSRQKPEPVWLAEVDLFNTADFTRYPKTGQKMAKNVFTKLAADRLIHPYKKPKWIDPVKD